MPPSTFDEFRARFGRPLKRLYEAGRGRRFGLAETDFAEALYRSQADRFRSHAHVANRDIDRYLSSLELEDLALVASCRRGLVHAWQTFRSEQLAGMHDAGRASAGDVAEARRSVDSLLAELQAGGEALEQYHGRSRLKTWLRALIARRNDALIRSPGALAGDVGEAAPWIDAVGQAVVALEPPERLRLAFHVLERLPTPSIAILLGETRRRVASALYATASTVRRAAESRLKREAKVKRRALRGFERELRGLVPAGDPRVAFEIAAAAALERRLNPPGHGCPGAAILASIVEGRLSEVERAATLQHAANCRGCVRQLGILARFERPGLGADRLELGRRSSPVGVIIVLTLVLLAALAVLAVHYEIPERLWRRLLPELARAPIVDPEPTSPPAPVPEAAATVPTPAEMPTPVDAAMPAAAIVEEPYEPPAEDESTTTPPGSSASADAAPDLGSEPTLALEPSPAAAVSTAEIPAPVTAAAEPTATPEPTAESTATLEPTATALPAARLPFPGDQPGSTAIVLAETDPTVRWWVAANGAIAITRDDGRTWTTLASGVDADLLSGSAPSSEICWVGGRRGTILRAVDGRNFVVVGSPGDADIVSIRARDAMRASITLANGGRYATSDGGETWQPEEAQ